MQYFSLEKNQMYATFLTQFQILVHRHIFEFPGVLHFAQTYVLSKLPFKAKRASDRTPSFLIF